VFPVICAFYSPANSVALQVVTVKLCLGAKIHFFKLLVAVTEHKDYFGVQNRRGKILIDGVV
jgi:hypothetical protein